MVPTVATTAAASVRSSASGRRRNASSLGTLRSSSPSMCAALSTEEWACSEHTTTCPPVAFRAAMSAASVEVDAVSSICPCQCPGSPSSWLTQSRTRPSSSVEAGEVRHRMATGLSAAASSSARMPGGDAVTEK